MQTIVRRSDLLSNRNVTKIFLLDSGIKEVVRNKKEGNQADWIEKQELLEYCKQKPAHIARMA